LDCAFWLAPGSSASHALGRVSNPVAEALATPTATPMRQRGCEFALRWPPEPINVYFKYLALGRAAQ
jgi:hypothetical protein